MRRIKIKNFGPIKEGYDPDSNWINLKKVTVFIGDNGTGKSVIAKMVSTLCWIEKAVFTGRLSEKELFRRKTLERYAKYHKLDDYFNPETYIKYEGDACIIEYQEERLKVIRKEDKDHRYKVPKIMYVGSERSFISVASSPERIKGLPESLGTFLDEYLRALEGLTGRVKLPFDGVELSYSKAKRTPLIHGTLIPHEITLSEASSGIQAAIPLILVSRFLARIVKEEEDSFQRKRSSEEESQLVKEIMEIIETPLLSVDTKRHLLRVLEGRFNPSLFYNIVEEPEQNLFPDTQRNLLHELLECVNYKVENVMMITTHSPYIISYLTFAVKAGILSEEIMKHEGHIPEGTRVAKALELNAIVPLKAAIRVEDLAIYEITKDGSLHSLNTIEGIPSDSHYLNHRLRLMNERFEKLLEIEMDIEEWQ